MKLVPLILYDKGEIIKTLTEEEVLKTNRVEVCQVKNPGQRQEPGE